MSSLKHISKELKLFLLLAEAATFAEQESLHDEPSLFGVTDGKAVGTYLEHKFIAFLSSKYSFQQGNSASGIDIPSLNIDIKVTSYHQPQSSCPYKSARQKIYGLGYGLLVFVYDKKDDEANRTSRLNILYTVYVERELTADYQMTKGILQIVEKNGNIDDLMAFLQDRNLPVDDIQAKSIAEEILINPPILGYLTISNALQWRLQYGRVISEAGNVKGIHRLR